jgi:hypothetical protein
MTAFKFTNVSNITRFTFFLSPTADVNTVTKRYSYQNITINIIRAMVWATESIRNDKEVVMTAVSNDGRELEFASRGLRNDKEVVMAAVCQWGHALEYASTSLKK